MATPNPAGDGPGAFDFDRLKLDRVSRHYGRRRALWRVSLEVAAGEVVGLLGPNGAGKSTLLRLLATLIAPSSGAVRYGDGTARQQGGALRRRIGYLSHDLQLYPELTARENLAFFASLYGDPHPGERVEAALRSARLDDRAEEPVQRFSRGMRQRLALERALLHGPRLILLDEPFTGLDDRSALDLAARLRALRGDGRMVLLATHDLDVVEDVIDRAVVLQRGRATLIDPGKRPLRERYRAALAANGAPAAAAGGTAAADSGTTGT